MSTSDAYDVVMTNFKDEICYRFMINLINRLHPEILSNSLDIN